MECDTLRTKLDRQRKWRSFFVVQKCGKNIIACIVDKDLLLLSEKLRRLPPSKIRIQIPRDGTKTEESNRTLPLVPEIKERLLALREEQKKYMRLCGHSDFSTAANIYSHLEYSGKITSATVMANGLSNALAAPS